VRVRWQGEFKRCRFIVVYPEQSLPGLFIIQTVSMLEKLNKLLLKAFFSTLGIAFNKFINKENNRWLLCVETAIIFL